MFLVYKLGEQCPISDLMSHFRLKPEVVGKWWLTPLSKRVVKVKAEK